MGWYTGEKVRRYAGEVGRYAGEVGRYTGEIRKETIVDKKR